MFLGRPNTATVHNARQNSILYTHTQARAHARTNLPFPSLHTSGCVPRVVHRGCLLCLVVNSSSTIIFFFFFLYRSLLETPPRSRNRYSRKFSGENFSLDFFQKIDGCRVIEIHTDISSRISSFFSSTGMINGIGRKRERERIRIRKKFITRRNLVKAFLFLFFSLVSLTRGVTPGYLIIFCKMNFSFLLFYASLIMIYRVILMSPGWSRFAIGRNWSLTSRLRKILEPLWPFLKLNREISPRRDLSPFFFFLLNCRVRILNHRLA